MEHLKNLRSAETKLKKLLDADKKNWTHFYLLLKEVEDQELWKEKYTSFTQWVKDFCVATKTHESIVWNRKKAGKVYESYARVKAEQGEQIQDLEKSNVSVDSLVLLDKINKHDEEVASKLVDKVLNKTITKKDLREVYQSIKQDRSVSVSSKKSKKNESEKPNEKTEKNKSEITANQIVSALFSIEWLGYEKKREYFKTSLESNKYRAFTEFPVYTGTSRKSRRIDVLACENVTTKNSYQTHLHGIEIKVSKSDLLNDKKYTEYTEFVDYLWLAVPKKLVEVALENKFEKCGVIAVNEDLTTEIIEPAKKLRPMKKAESLSVIALKLI